MSAAPRIDPALKNILGLDSDDPAAFVVAILKKGRASFVTLQNRVCDRADLRVVTIPDADPNKAGKQAAKINVRAAGNESWEKLGAKIATVVMRGPAAAGLYLDESRRMVTGQKVGPKTRALDAPGGELGEHDELVSDTSFNILAPRSARSLAGIDDAILLGLGVTVLVALIPFVLPLLVELGKGAFDFVVKATTGQDPKPPPGGDGGGGGGGEDVDAVFAPADDLLDSVGIGDPKKDDTFLALGILAALVVGVIWLKRRGKAGG